MADIRPFRAYRPAKELAPRIAALPYDVYSREEAIKEVEREPLSFLRIDRAETNFPDSTGTYDDCVYEKAKELLEQMISEGELIQDDRPCYYIYEQTMEGRTQTGIVACASVEDYCRDVIKKHENTRKDKERDRSRHVDACSAHTGPIFLTYRSSAAVNELTAREKLAEPVYNFTTPDGIGHRVWKVDAEPVMEQISLLFSRIRQLYIADGHHRCASAVTTALKRKTQDSAHTGMEEYNYFLSILFPDSELKLMEYNRVVRDCRGRNRQDILNKIAENFQIEERGEAAFHPEHKGSIAMYLEGMWYCLSLAGGRPENPVESLDVSCLQRLVLEPVFGIQDPTKDPRIEFVGGIKGLAALEEKADRSHGAAFALFPVSIGELFAVADAGLLMPPKSTWFEPKLRSGLFIHKF